MEAEVWDEDAVVEDVGVPFVAEAVVLPVPADPPDPSDAPAPAG
ncbi:hypothetical protein [Mycobacterium yunnanensis]|nr:hypothetical protein [Mycobacterium yunnanensis]